MPSQQKKKKQHLWVSNSSSAGCGNSHPLDAQLPPPSVGALATLAGCLCDCVLQARGGARCSLPNLGVGEFGCWLAPCSPSQENKSKCQGSVVIPDPDNSKLKSVGAVHMPGKPAWSNILAESQTPAPLPCLFAQRPHLLCITAVGRIPTDQLLPRVLAETFPVQYCAYQTRKIAMYRWN